MVTETQCNESDNPDAEHLFALAFVLYKTENIDSALRKCLEAINADTNGHEEYPLLAARIFSEQGKLKKAHSVLGEARQKFPLSHEVCIELGCLCDALGHCDHAVELYSEALDCSPENIEVAGSLARLYVDDADYQAAFDVWTKSVDANAEEPAPCFLAASMFSCLDRDDLAEHFLQRAQTAFPDHVYPPYLLAAIRQDSVPARASKDYIRTYFDQFAREYDNTLRSLDNQGPELVSKIILRLGLVKEPTRSILDAGCGTGLCGRVLSDYASWLTGVDLSEKMLEQARARGGYNDIICDDIIDFACRTGKQFELIVLSDVLVYFGDLSEVLKSLSGCLASGGHVIFTLEELSISDHKPGYRLSTTGRFKHTRGYVEDVLERCGFSSLPVIERNNLRSEYGEPVDCFLVAT